MPTQYVTIPRGTYQILLREVQRAVEVCGEIAGARLSLVALRDRLEARGDKAAIETLDKTISACVELIGMRVEFSATERRLRELDQELTPLRPPSRTDMQAAFQNSVDFLHGKKKPPDTE